MPETHRIGFARVAPLAHVHAYKSVHTAAYLLSSGIISRACNDTACIRVYIHIYPPPRLPPSVVCSRVCQYRDPHANHRDRCAARNSTTTYDDDDDRIWVDLSSSPPPPLIFSLFLFIIFRTTEMIISRVLNLRISLLIRENFRPRVKIRQTKHHPACIRPRKS